LCFAISASASKARKAMVRNIVFIGLFLTPAVGAQGYQRDDALSAVLRCSGMSDKAQRLVCYDSAMVRVPGVLHAPSPAPSVVSAPVTTTASAAPPAAVVRRQRSSGFIASLFGPGGPNRAPQTTVAQFGSESIANGGRQAYPIPWTKTRLTKSRPAWPITM
jgi:hypothetical protein